MKAYQYDGLPEEESKEIPIPEELKELALEKENICLKRLLIMMRN